MNSKPDARDELREFVENKLGINPLYDPNVSSRDVVEAMNVVADYTQAVAEERVREAYETSKKHVESHIEHKSFIEDCVSNILMHIDNELAKQEQKDKSS
jgi:hypothetical protein